MGLACLACWGGGGGSGGVSPALGSWIDPDTLPEDRTKAFVGDEREFGLVFSDEFNRWVQYLHVHVLCTGKSNTEYQVLNCELPVFTDTCDTCYFYVF